jgi:hypothetical protein
VVASTAPPAAPAGRVVGADHDITDRVLANPVPALYDLPDELVAQDEAARERVGVGEDVQVGPTHGSTLHPHDRVGGRAQARVGDVLDADLSVTGVHDGLHREPPRLTTPAA